MSMNECASINLNYYSDIPAFNVHIDARWQSKEKEHGVM